MNLRQGHQLLPIPCSLGVLEKQGGPTPLSKAAGTSSSLAAGGQAVPVTGPHLDPSSGAQPPYPS